MDLLDCEHRRCHCADCSILVSPGDICSEDSTSESSSPQEGDWKLQTADKVGKTGSYVRPSLEDKLCASVSHALHPAGAAGHSLVQGVSIRADVSGVSWLQTYGTTPP